MTRVPTFIVATVVLASVAACARQSSEREIFQMSGAEMYGRLCTTCHGVKGKGDGPMAPLLKIDVPDLTRIAQRNGGEFPAERVRNTIDGRFEQPAHGLPYMPIWGLRFYDRSNPYGAEERARGDAIVDRLVAHLRSIQED